MRFIGDIHADYNFLLKKIKDIDESIQVGDFGIGFRLNPTHLYDYNKHLFIRGNHDDPRLCKSQPNYIEDGTVKNDIMFVGGASSIDKAWRVEDIDWWRDEELSYEDLDRMIDIFDVTRPNVMVTHEAPNYAVKHFGLRIFEDNSRTRGAFDRMFEMHKPKFWIFGHWHIDFDKIIDGCRFICINQRSYADIDLNGAIDQKIEYHR